MPDPVRSATYDSTFLRACRGEPVDFTPVWFMRQAGRALPEYRKLRAGMSMLEACSNPELITEITLQPVRRYGVDAAILFSDIVVPLRAVGVELDIEPGIGPVIASPLRRRTDLERLPPLQPENVPYVAEAVHALVGELDQTPLIGFAGAPFTLASYLIEGGPSRNHTYTKALMYSEPQLWHDLLARLAEISAGFLEVQVAAGASAVQLFDSWVGVLSEADYTEYVLPHSRNVLDRLAETGVPKIHFGVGTGELLAAMARAGADVVGVDWRLPLAEAARRIGPDCSVQGNVDPALVFAPWPVLTDRTRQVLQQGRALPGHVFNLGHGVLPDTDPDVLTRLVDFVHEQSSTR